MTYTKDDFRQMFQKPFNIDEWQQILQHYFHATELRAEPERTKESTDDEQGYYLGAIDTADSYRIGLFYYKIQHGNIARKRVGLRNLVKSFVNPLLGDFNAALVVFDSGTLWRLSLICDMKGESTAPKRFTYVFGESDNYYNTPVGRFKALQDKGISYANLRDAFSVEQVNKTFFAEYKAQYEKFCQYLCEDPEMQQSFQQFSENSGKAIRDYVKKMLGRIVFLYFVQRKGWLNGDLLYMSRLFSQSSDDVKADFLDRVLEPMFFGLLNTPQEERHANAQANGWDLSLIPGWTNIPYLNGGLFEQDSIDKCKSVFPCDYFKGLFDFFDSYNFTIDENDPNDAEVGIDPEMLGVIFENLLEDNKDKGAFYTPKEIVRYMCQESLIAYLNTNTDIPQEQLRQFVISPEDNAEGFSADSKAKLLSALQTVKICDPAIGSGAFPMGLLNELLHCREALGESANHAQIKKSIIQNNIYGVDIEKGAVDIARLRFWLSLVVDEDVPQPLPNLDYKIMQGNSLLESFMGYDLSRILPVNKNGKTSKFATKTASDNDRQGRLVFGEEQDSIAEIQRLIRLYFSPQNHKQKETLKRNIDTKVKEYIIICGGNTPSIVEAVEKIDDNNKPFFLWHLFFADVFQEGGFDIVIANPPYKILTKNNTETQLLEAYLAKYKSIKKASSKNLFTLFIEKSIESLTCKTNAVISYIVPEGLYKTRSYNECVNIMSQHGQTTKIVTFTDYVFDNAITGNVIFVYQKGIYGYVTEKYVYIEDGEFRPLIENENPLLEKIVRNTKPLSEIAYLFKGMVIKDRDMMLHNKQESYSHKFILGKNISKWSINSYYYTNFSDLTIIGGTKRIEKHDVFPRIVIRRTGNELCCAKLECPCLTESTLYSCWLKDEKLDINYLYGLLNSRLLNYYNYNKNITNQQGFPQILMTDLQQLPIRIGDKQQITTIASSVNNKNEDSYTDFLVYHLYGLTYDEVLIVDPDTPITREEYENINI